jgi:hypothetical protein
MRGFFYRELHSIGVRRPGAAVQHNPSIVFILFNTSNSALILTGDLPAVALESDK